MNAQISQCPNCGKRLSPGALMGLCPACLLNTRFDSLDNVPNARTFVPPAPHIVERHFPNLEVIELIGQGGMGAVYKARQTKLDRFVALKILRTFPDPDFADRFEREARALAKFQHPNIVTLYEYGRADGQYYLLMEYVDGVNLRQLLDSRHVSPKEALAIVPQICDALQYAHDRGVVHRDIKPENILMDQRGTVKIADFGVAKMLGASAENDARKLVGTPRYMAPEQLLNPMKADNRADIYALGAVLYQMLTGDLPAGKFERPSRKMFIDVRLDDLVLRALEKQPEKRYQQVSALKTRIESLVQEVLNNPKPRRRIRVGVILAGVALVVCLGTALVLFGNLTKDLETGKVEHDSNGKPLTVDLGGDGSLEDSDEAGISGKSKASGAAKAEAGAVASPSPEEAGAKKISDEEALAKALSELKGATTLGKIEVAELLAGAIVSGAAGSKNSSFAITESIFVVRASPGSIRQNFARWSPVGAGTKVLRHHRERTPTFDTVVSLPYGNTTRWISALTKATEKLPESYILNLSEEEFASYRVGTGDGTVFPPHIRDFWLNVMNQRQLTFLREKNDARIEPYKKPTWTVDPMKEFAKLERKDGLLKDSKSASYYWEFVEVLEGPWPLGGFVLGVRNTRNVSAIVVTGDFQYYRSAGDYASYSEQRVSPVTVEGKNASLVWQRDYVLKFKPGPSPKEWESLSEAEKQLVFRWQREQEMNSFQLQDQEEKPEVPPEIKLKIDRFRKTMEESEQKK